MIGWSSECIISCSALGFNYVSKTVYSLQSSQSAADQLLCPPLLHAEQCRSLKIQPLFVWRADVQYLSPIRCIAGISNACLAGHPPQIQRTEDRGFPHRGRRCCTETLLFVGGGALSVSNYCIVAGTVIFYSTGSSR